MIQYAFVWFALVLPQGPDSQGVYTLNQQVMEYHTALEANPQLSLEISKWLLGKPSHFKPR